MAICICKHDGQKHRGSSLHYPQSLKVGRTLKVGAEWLGSDLRIQVQGTIGCFPEECGGGDMLSEQIPDFERRHTLRLVYHL